MSHALRSALLAFLFCLNLGNSAEGAPYPSLNGPDGDTDGNGIVNVADAFHLINNLFAGGPPLLGPGDVDADGIVSVSDVFYLIDFLFTGGTAPICTPPDSSIIANSPIVANSINNAASVANSGAGSTYSWTISNGTITSGQGTRSVSFTAGSAGSTTLTVTVTRGTCQASGTRVVTVTAPQAQITAFTSEDVSVGSSANADLM